MKLGKCAGLHLRKAFLCSLVGNTGPFLPGASEKRALVRPPRACAPPSAAPASGLERTPFPPPFRRKWRPPRRRRGRLRGEHGFRRACLAAGVPGLHGTMGLAVNEFPSNPRRRSTSSPLPYILCFPHLPQRHRASRGLHLHPADGQRRLLQQGAGERGGRRGKGGGGGREQR